MTAMGKKWQLCIFLFIFNENEPENLWATKGIGGERRIWGWYIVMRLVRAEAMAMATV
jgi:hypothetical protein